MYRTYTLRLIGATAALLLLCASVVLVLDPAFQYHLPLPGVEPVYSNERYQNAGLIKNQNYDAICIGSSVTSNFRASWFDKAFGGKTLKVSYPGGTFSDFDLALETAYATHEVKTVYWSLDPRLMSADPTDAHEMPAYLYDFNVVNDIKYLLNKDILLESCTTTLLASLTGKHAELDEAFTWEEGKKFGLQAAIASYERPPKSDVEYDRHLFDAERLANWEILDKWIDGHPETTFYLYFPPYSTLYMDSIVREGKVEPMIYLLYDTANRYKDKPNVRFYSFMEHNNITTDYDNYTDMVHYKSSVNQYIIDYMATHPPLDEKGVTHMVSALRSLVTRYDFDSLYPATAQEPK